MPIWTDPPPHTSAYPEIVGWLTTHSPTEEFPSTWTQVGPNCWDGTILHGTLEDLHHVVNHPKIPATFHAKLMVKLCSLWFFGHRTKPIAQAYARNIVLRLEKERNAHEERTREDTRLLRRGLLQYQVELEAILFNGILR